MLALCATLGTLVSGEEVFKEHDLKALGGDLAIGHTRYSTTGSNEWENSQPVHRSAGSA